MKTEAHDALLLFSKALKRLAEALAEDRSNPLAIDGSIQRFKFSLVLIWDGSYLKKC